MNVIEVRFLGEKGTRFLVEWRHFDLTVLICESEGFILSVYICPVVVLVANAVYTFEFTLNVPLV